MEVGTGADDFVSSILVRQEGKILLGGGFTSFNGTVRYSVAQLNSDGSLDTSFDPGQGANAPVRAMAFQLDESLLLAGEFTEYDNEARMHLVRVDDKGIIDSTLDIEDGGPNAPIYALAVQRLETHVPSWPIPKLFRLASKKKLIKGIFEGGTINTPSMICVEDVLDSLNWVESIGGTKELVKISNENLKIVEDWVGKSDWVKFMCQDKSTRSSTSITLLIKDEWFNKFNEEDQRGVLKKLFSLLEKEGVANDINGYPKAPPSIRIWGGSTVQNNDMKALLPWIDWAYNSVKNNA